MKKLFGAARSKTMWFSLLLVVFGVVEANLALLQELIPAKYYGLVVIGIGVITAALRWITTRGLEDKSTKG